MAGLVETGGGLLLALGFLTPAYWHLVERDIEIGHRWE